MEKMIAVVYALVGGNSIRSVKRITNVHRDTIIRLLHRVGAHCERIMDERMCNLECRSIQADEIWAFVKKKQGHVTTEEKAFRPDWGNQYVFVGLDAETKLIPVYEVGKRNMPTA